MMARLHAFRDRAFGLFLLATVAVGVGVILDQCSRAEMAKDWDGARVADVSSRGGLNRRITLEWENAVTARLGLDTKDEGVFGIDLPLHRGTAVSFYDSQGHRLDSPSSSSVNDCVRLIVDGMPVGARGQENSVVCSHRGGRIVWNWVRGEKE